MKDKSILSINKKSAVTLFEIMIVVALSSAVLLSASQVMSRTTTTFKRGSDMLNTQLLLEIIVERLRTDIRNLLKAKKRTAGLSDLANDDFGAKSEKVNFLVGKRDAEGKMTEIEIEYSYEDGTLWRRERGENQAITRETNFQAKGKIRNLAFSWIKDVAGPKGGEGSIYLTMILEVISNEPGENKPTTLPFICNFHSKCMADFSPSFLGNLSAN